MYWKLIVDKEAKLTMKRQNLVQNISAEAEGGKKVRHRNQVARCKRTYALQYAAAAGRHPTAPKQDHTVVSQQRDSAKFLLAICESPIPFRRRLTPHDALRVVRFQRLYFTPVTQPSSVL